MIVFLYFCLLWPTQTLPLGKPKVLASYVYTGFNLNHPLGMESGRERIWGREWERLKWGVGVGTQHTISISTAQLLISCTTYCVGVCGVMHGISLHKGLYSVPVWVRLGCLYTNTELEGVVCECVCVHIIQGRRLITTNHREKCFHFAKLTRPWNKIRKV